MINEMKNYTVRFVPEEAVAKCAANETLMDCAQSAGISITASCGGNGICKKCRVRLISGTLSTTPFEEENIYLACLSRPLSDCVVELISTEDNLPASELKHTDMMYLPEELSPGVKKKCFSLKKVNINETKPIYNEIIRVLAASEPALNQEKMTITSSTLKRLPDILKSFDALFTVTYDIHNRIIDVEKGDTETHLYGMAVDAGTTTVEVCIVDLKSGKVLSMSSLYNRQRSYGDDVISRIIYAEKKKGIKALQESVVESINSIAEHIAASHNISLEHIYRVVVAGNTTMIHLLLGLDPSPIRHETYEPGSELKKQYFAANIGLKANSDAEIVVLPAVAEFIGGDIVAGILGTGLFKEDKLRLLIDLGTNGELVLGNSDWIIACSCSVGPAFEGGSISSGTRAVPGAIDTLTISKETLDPVYTTIDDRRPSGLCGSGILDLLTSMLKAGIIDRQGAINRSLFSSRIRPDGNVYEYVVEWKGSTNLEKDLTINEHDIKNIIRAKAAVFAGITMLLKSMDLDYGDPCEIIIAGNFGRYINFENAIIAGLLPEVDTEKYSCRGNTSLAGALMYLNDYHLKTRISEIASSVTCLNLSASSEFMEFFTAGLFLPHTDLNLFPISAKI
jgi:uncharacterized 2Fe-2S/4Fe-4S cluster protein (DUF4445 family)